MRMTRLLISMALAVMLAGPVFAGPVEDSVVQQLRAQGFSNIEVTRTWLGRARISAQRGSIFREIVVDPRTGEILRDYSERASGGTVPALLQPETGGAGQSDPETSYKAQGEDREDDYDDRDDDDDDRDDGDDDSDNSGSGKGNSGSDGDDGDDGDEGEADGDGEGDGDGDGDGDGEGDGGDD